jgi:2-polyprenyl-3-methyl-5-hydroxy-6-metoxy-1,4-benzoquinol methylase
MDYQSLTVNNKNFLKRFSHISRFIIASKFLNEFKLNSKMSLLDFGSGNGFFLKFLIDEKFKLNLNAFEPIKKQLEEMDQLFRTNNIKNVQIFEDLDKINTKFDIITCFETLEHFNEENQRKLLIQIRSSLKKNGVIILSVPIEVYISGFFKIALRIIMKQKHEGTNVFNIFKTLLGLKINRDKISEKQYIESHMGFYYFDLLKIIKEMNFKIIKKKFSPFSFLGAILNSQIFLKLECKD